MNFISIYENRRMKHGNCSKKVGDRGKREND
jgi:hypothetical protein